MSAFCEDSRKVAQYPEGIFGERRDEKTPFMRCLQWGNNVPDGERDVTFDFAQELTSSAAEERLRVVFLANCSKKTSGPDLEEFMKIYKHYGVPSDVLTERMRSVNHSFGSSTTIGTDAEIAWCHFLCRRLDFSGSFLRNEQGGLNKASLNLWLMTDFFLHAAKDKTVTLFCFGAPDGIVDRFEELLDKSSWRDILEEPYLLWAIIFDELHDFFDTLSMQLAKIVRDVEGAAVNESRAPKLPFKTLQEFQRMCILMIETAEATMSTFDAMQESLSESTTAKPSRMRKSTISAIAYRKRTFKSTLLRLYSLEKRAFASVQMYQTLVTQFDSHAMKFIAVLTLIFFPITGVSTVFSSPFFNVDFDQNSTPLQVAGCIWKFWAVVAPLTLGIGLLCYFWFRYPHFFSNFFTTLLSGLWGENSYWKMLLRAREARRKKEKSGV